MIVYLAELSHEQRGIAAPLAAGYLAATVQARYPDTEIAIFSDPYRLMEAMDVRPPHILGFSLHLWSERLSAYCARYAKRNNPGLCVVIGGPNISYDSNEIAMTLAQHSYYDFAVAGEGEEALCNLIAHMECFGIHGADLPKGLARLGSEGKLVRGQYHRPDLIDIPSPYLTGWLDPFLHDGYVPVVQTMRGCPYRCKFCVSGAMEWDTLRAYPLKRVYDEFVYVREHAKSDSLILSDENLGILKARDVDLCRWLRQSKDIVGWPAHLYAYTAKIVTPYVRSAIEILAPFAEFCQSFQTLDDNVRRAIGRTNQSQRAFCDNIRWAKEKLILTSTEMIFGLPGETKNSYMSGLEWILQSGVDRIYSYNLKLLPGSALASQGSRREHHYQTRFRLVDRAYGRYGNDVVAEAEEVVVSSESFSFSDYLYIRRYGLWLELASGRGYLTEVMAKMTKANMPSSRLIGWLAQNRFYGLPRIRQLLAEYDRAVRHELMDSPEECERYAAQYLDMDKCVPEAKINYIYTGLIMLDPLTQTELWSAIHRFCRRYGTPKQQAIVMDFIEQNACRRVVMFRADESAEIRCGGSIFTLHVDAKRQIARQPLENINDHATIQDIYMGVSRFGLMRQHREVII